MAYPRCSAGVRAVETQKARETIRSCSRVKTAYFAVRQPGLRRAISFARFETTAENKQ